LGLFIFGCFIGDISFYEGVRDYSISTHPGGTYHSAGAGAGASSLALRTKVWAEIFVDQGLFSMFFYPRNKMDKYKPAKIVVS
jgi:hypothetical protein